MDRQPLVSVLINNYNYGRFLAEAIDSALNQTYPHVEVIVVDDGSTDDSRQIIAGYGDRILPVLKENGGQASAMNAGFAVSKGHVLFHLDSDDLFRADKVARIVRFLADRDLLDGDVIVSHRVEIVDVQGQPLEGRAFKHRHSDGENYYRWSKKTGASLYPTSIPSGVAVTRPLAQRIFPLPEGERSGGDNFLVRAGGLLGHVHSLDHVLASYRYHGGNHWYGDQKPKPKPFLDIEERFLNLRLVENGRQPVLTYAASLPFAVTYRQYYADQGQWYRVLWLAIRVPCRCLSRSTVRFAIESVGNAVMVALSFRRRDHAHAAIGS